MTDGHRPDAPPPPNVPPHRPDGPPSPARQPEQGAPTQPGPQNSQPIPPYGQPAAPPQYNQPTQQLNQQGQQFGQPGQQYGQTPQPGQQYPPQAPYGQPQQFAAGQQPYPQPFQQRPKKSRKGWIIGGSVLGALIILGVAGFLVVGQLNKTQHGPDQVASRYFEALSSGDITGAKAIAAPVVPDGASDALLNDAAVKASGAKIDSAKVVRTAVDGDDAAITVSYTVGGKPQSLRLTATKDGKEGLFFDKWKLAGPSLDAVDINASSASEVVINGAKVPLKDGEAVLAAYPGSYKVELPDSKFFSGSDDTVTLGFAPAGGTEPAPVTLTRKANDALTQEVQRQVKDIVTKCAENKDPRVKGCPFYSAETDIKPGTVKWDLTKQPVVAVTASPEGKIIILSKELGQIKYRADSKHPGSTGKYWTGGGSFAVYGTGTVDGDKITVTLTSGA